MKILLALLLCASCYAAPPLPLIPTVTRKAPLQSPRAASVPKSTPMFVTASELPVLPMVPYFRVANSEFGTYEFSASAWQPTGYAILFEVSPTVGLLAQWEPLAWFGPYVVDQQVFAGLYSYSVTLYIRATPTLSPAPAVLTEVNSTVLLSESGKAIMSRRVASAKVAVNPRFKGVRAWVSPRF